MQQVDYNESPIFQTQDCSPIENWLRTIIAEKMHMQKDEIDADTPFSEYGVDSLISLEILKPINDMVGYVPATLLFEHPNLSVLAKYFNKNFSAKFDSLQTIPEVKSVQELDSIKIEARKIISTILHCNKEEIKDTTIFSDLGIDSLISLEVVTELQKIFGYLPATILFENPTLHDLTLYIKQNSSIHEQIKSEVPLASATQPNTAEENDNTIAIVGIAAKLPGAEDYERFWELLCQGKDAFVQIPEQRFKVNTDKSYTKIAALIEDVDCFDHDFFNITPIEAERMDPQERLFLQTTYHAIEDAGLNIDELQGENIGCYVGVMNHGYSWLSLKDHNQSEPNSLYWSIANRASYQFDWRGPSFAIDSACSSSLTALHTATTALLYGDCDMAIVGGVNIIAHPRQIDVLSQLHMLSPTDSCKPFGKGADGFIDGEGVVSIMLMPYKEARAKGLNVYAKIRGTSVNAGGKANGYTAPNPNAQAILIKKALQRAKLKPSDIHVIEAHGTGTALGDPIEIRALTEAFKETPLQTIPIGSVKGNIGHLESAAGLASLVKMLLQMKHKQLVPSLHSEIENVHLKLEQSPFYINKQLTSLHNESPIYTAISSFGAGGANAHVILESCEPISSFNSQQNHYLFPISAHSEAALQNTLLQLSRQIIDKKNDLAALSYAYCCIKKQHQHRLGFVVESVEQLLSYCKTPLSQLKSIVIQNKKQVSLSASNLINTYISNNMQQIDIAHDILHLFNQGKEISFKELFVKKPVIAVPAYSFDKHKHWVDAIESNFLSQSELVKQHVILGQTIAPAALSLSMFYAKRRFESIVNVIWKKVAKDIENLRVSIDENGYKLTDISKQVIYCEAKTNIGSHKTQNNLLQNKLHIENAKVLNEEQIYQMFAQKGYAYGHDLRGIKQAHVSKQTVSSILYIAADYGLELSPCVIDCALQTAILTEIETPNENIKAPFLIEEVVIHKLPNLCQAIYCFCESRQVQSDNSSHYDIVLCDSSSSPLIELNGVVSVSTINKELLSQTDSTASEDYSLKIIELN